MPDELAPEDLGESPGRSAANEVHLREPVLGVKRAPRRRRVLLRVDVRDAVAIAHDAGLGTERSDVVARIRRRLAAATTSRWSRSPPPRSPPDPVPASNGAPNRSRSRPNTARAVLPWTRRRPRRAPHSPRAGPADPGQPLGSCWFISFRRSRIGLGHASAIDTALPSLRQDSRWLRPGGGPHEHFLRRPSRLRSARTNHARAS